MTGTRTPISLKPFNRNDDFLVRRPLKIQGKTFADGDPLDKELLTTRRLRQLYETRHIVVAPLDPNKKPDFFTMPTDKVTKWLVSHGEIPRYGAKRASLIAQAERHWESRGNDSVKTNGRA
jgi:hypothetical protein